MPPIVMSSTDILINSPMFTSVINVHHKYPRSLHRSLWYITGHRIQIRKAFFHHYPQHLTKPILVPMIQRPSSLTFNLPRGILSNTLLAHLESFYLAGLIDLPGCILKKPNQIIMDSWRERRGNTLQILATRWKYLILNIFKHSELIFARETASYLYL